MRQRPVLCDSRRLPLSKVWFVGEWIMSYNDNLKTEALTSIAKSLKSIAESLDKMAPKESEPEVEDDDFIYEWKEHEWSSLTTALTTGCIHCGISAVKVRLRKDIFCEVRSRKEANNG